MTTAQEKIVKWSLDQVGYVADSNRRNKYAAHLDSIGFYLGNKNGYDWCECFNDDGMVICFGEELTRKMTNQPKQSYGAGCTQSASYYRAKGWWSTSPQLGAQIYFGTYGDESHTGRVVGFDSYTVTTVEGNTGYSSGYSGGAVLKHTYSRNDSNIVGYGIPNWSLVEDEVTNEDINKIADLVVDKLTRKNSLGASPISTAVWGARNKELESVDMRQIIADIRCALDIKDGQKYPTKTSSNLSKFYKDSGVYRLEQKLDKVIKLLSSNAAK